MTASSFDAVPGLPILHSKGLSELEDHRTCIETPTAFRSFFLKLSMVMAVWAPAIRYHKQ